MTNHYVCLVHATMNGVVHVRNSALPKTQAQYDAESRILAPLILARALVLQGVGTAEAVAKGRNQVTTGIGQLFHTGGIAVLRFMPNQNVIHAGQTVTWRNSDPETPHTVTFGTEPPGGPFGAFGPSPNVSQGHATVSSTSDWVNSGFIGKMGPTFGSTFQVTFKTPGVYPYICALHDDQGMVGTITVLS